MAKSNEQQFEEAAIQLARLAYTLTEGKVQSVSVDFQASGEYPWRIVVPDEGLPLAGLATDQSPPDPDADPQRSVSVSAGKDT